MTTFLLLLLLIFVIWPMVRGMIAIARARRSARRFFEQFRQAAGAPDGQQRNAPEQPQPKPRKKINPDDGEFVAFEDLPADTSTEPTTFASVEIEQQIVDVEWEDIK
ncbi:MAG: hypothetical protein K2K94_01540 [Muribaculaceae bacterium]|nr:hypothetical protein [Muribaculaceae bacterium]